ncbi:NUDIX domain-containing protein [Actinomadura nitritigenes]|uniref:NUDIX domain-containing protein n=1 Tax=Actinomadura nitritigenes TaxID=134602 RepID=UPI003D909554
MLLTGPQRHVLLVKTHYRPDCGLPGGVAEDNELPYLAFAREIYEEVGLARPAAPLLAVDSVATGLVHLPRPGGAWSRRPAFQCGITVISGRL